MAQRKERSLFMCCILVPQVTDIVIWKSGSESRFLSLKILCVLASHLRGHGTVLELLETTSRIKFIDEIANPVCLDLSSYVTCYLCDGEEKCFCSCTTFYTYLRNECFSACEVFRMCWTHSKCLPV